MLEMKNIMEKKWRVLPMDHQQTRPEKRIFELEDKSREIIHSETQREKEI